MKSRVLENGIKSWECRIDKDHDQADEATAVVHIPIDGSPHMVVQVCEIDSIPCGPDEYGDNNIIRDGEDGERWRNSATALQERLSINRQVSQELFRHITGKQKKKYHRE